MRIGPILFTVCVLIVSLLVLWRDYSSAPYIDPALVKYVKEWSRDMDSADIRYTHVFNSIDNIILYDGPEFGESDIRTIKVNRDLLRSEWLVRQTVYHELGHNIFKLEHDTVESIMYSNNLGEEFYKNNWTQLKNYYITKCKGE